MNILSVSTMDSGGGAQSVAVSLFREYARRGHASWLAVGARRRETDHVVEIPSKRAGGVWPALCRALARPFAPGPDGIGGSRRWHTYFNELVEPVNFFRKRFGHEIFDYPGSRRLVELIPNSPDIIHCHNLHGPHLPRGGYFDLRFLPDLSARLPVVLTLHDAWLLSGHCAHSFDCERWKTGCGACPDLSIYPSIRRDATALNWRVKRRIFARSRLHVACPSLWLMRKVEQSILQPAIATSRVIPNGIDLSLFHPAHRAEARRQLGLPAGARVLMFAAHGVRRNIWKDYDTMRAALALAAERLTDRETLFLAVGEEAPPETVGRARMVFVPPQDTPETMALHYQAADAYVHAARAENCSLAILEAMACGAPVIATDVGGIPEQVRDGVNGFLTPPQDARSMADRIVDVLTDSDRHDRLSAQARATVTKRFSLETMANGYLDWFQQIARR